MHKDGADDDGVARDDRADAQVAGAAARLQVELRVANLGCRLRVGVARVEGAELGVGTRLDERVARQPAQQRRLQPKRREDLERRVVGRGPPFPSLTAMSRSCAACGSSSSWMCAADARRSTSKTRVSTPAARMDSSTRLARSRFTRLVSSLDDDVVDASLRGVTHAVALAGRSEERALLLAGQSDAIHEGRLPGDLSEAQIRRARQQVLAPVLEVLGELVVRRLQVNAVRVRRHLQGAVPAARPRGRHT